MTVGLFTIDKNQFQTRLVQKKIRLNKTMQRGYKLPTRCKWLNNNNKHYIQISNKTLFVC